MAKHIRYEMDALAAAEHWIPHLRHAKGAEYRLILEAFLLHSRVMRDFFLNDRGKEDDVLACSFFSSAEAWKAKRGEEYHCLTCTRGRIDQLLAHLTLGRITREESDFEWDTTTLYRELRALYARFIEALPADQQTWFTPEE